MKPRNLFDAATARGSVIRQGDIATIVMDGAGAIIVWSQDLQQAQKWAQSRLPTSNMLSDRARFLDQFGVLVSRPGSLQSTRGNDRQLEKMAKAMMAAGYDLAEWTLPAELKTLGHAPKVEPEKKKPVADEEEASPPEPEPPA
jgi:hypothetical protein